MSRNSPALRLAFSYCAHAQVGLDLAGRAARRRDDVLGVLGEQLLVHAGLVVVALEAGQRAELEQPVHALGARREHRHVGVGAAARDVVLAAVAPAHPGLVEPAAGGDVGLGADDRLDAVRRRLLPEVVGAEHVAVVGHRQRRHAELGGAGEQLVEARRAVEHGVLGVHVQVHERVLLDPRLGRLLPSSALSGDSVGPRGRRAVLVPGRLCHGPRTERRTTHRTDRASHRRARRTSRHRRRPAADAAQRPRCAGLRPFSEQAERRAGRGVCMHASPRR